jgi:hypothetical protein
VDVVIPALYALIKGYLTIPLWMGLGDALYRFKISFVYYVYYRRARFDAAWRYWDQRWYWKDNSAMWLADLMWEDLLKFYERLWLWYFVNLYTLKRRMENFADYPYTHLWYLIKFIWFYVSPLKNARRFASFANRTFPRFAPRSKVLLESFKIKVYLGLTSDEYRTGRIKGLIDFPKVFDFKNFKVVKRDDFVVLPDRWR